MCPVAATQRMFSGCGDRDPPVRAQLPGRVPPPPGASGAPSAPAPHLEVEVEDAHVVHEADALADLPDEHHAVHLRQVVVVVHDALEELAALNAARARTGGSPGQLGGSLPTPSSCSPLAWALSPAQPRHSQLHEEDDLPRRLDGIVELDEVPVVQLVHHVDLQQHHLLRQQPHRGGWCQPQPSHRHGAGLGDSPWGRGGTAARSPPVWHPGDSLEIGQTLSLAPCFLMTLAASLSPVCFSVHVWTSPNLPLRNRGGVGGTTATWGPRHPRQQLPAGMGTAPSWVLEAPRGPLRCSELG